MSLQTWRECLIASYAAGPTLSNSAVATSILNPNSKLTFDPEYFEVGRIIELTALCALSNIVTTPGTILFDVRLGGTLVFTSDAYQMTTTASTLLPFLFRVRLTCFTDGSAANFMGEGWASGRIFPTGGSGTAGVNFTQSNGLVPVPQGIPAVGPNFDATISQQLDVFGTFSIANAGNALQVQQYYVESLN